MSDLPLGTPRLRKWELNSSSTRYDRLVAAPSDDQLRIMWTTWAAAGFIGFCFVSFVFCAILRNKAARQNSFNVYLLFLMVPDMAYCFFCSATRSLNASAGHYYSPSLCKFQSFYVVWAVASCAWMNAVVAWQLHIMLQSSHIRKRYTPPTRLRVTYHAACVYSLTAFIASWGLWDVPWFPHRTAAIGGIGCLPLEYSWQSSLVFFLVYIPAFGGIPLLYVGWVCYDVWKSQLVPPSGRRRLLFLYFLRIIAAFVVVWTPFLILVFVAGGNPWSIYFGGTWSHVAGLVATSFSLFKPDVYLAFTDLLYCRRLRNMVLDEGRPSTSHGGRRDSFLSGLALSFRGSSRLHNNSAGCTNSTQVGNISLANVPTSWNSSENAHNGERENHPASSSARRVSYLQEGYVEGFVPVQSEDFTFEDEQDNSQIFTIEEESTPGGVKQKPRRSFRHSLRQSFGSMIPEEGEESSKSEHTGTAVEAELRSDSFNDAESDDRIMDYVSSSWASAPASTRIPGNDDGNISRSGLFSDDTSSIVTA